MDYDEFLHGKITVAPVSGFEVKPEDVNPALKPHQRDAVMWAVRGGRRALFESFGLGKTAQELEFCRLVIDHEGGSALIILPLGVRQEFTRDAAELLGMAPPVYVRNMEEVKAADAKILMTNYERVRDGDIDPKFFTATALDEASVLRSYGSKTFQEFMQLFKGVGYKLVATATPSPNRYKELIHYAGYLEIMDTGQALTRFFQRDSTKANNLTLYPHKEEEFWLWVSSWALFLGRPSDLGYDDTGYDLPPLDVRTHLIHSHLGDVVDKDGQVKLMRDAAVNLMDAAKEKRESVAERVAIAKEIVDSDPEAHFILWHDLEYEREEIEATFPSRDFQYWHEYKDGNRKALELYERHYSCYQYANGRDRKLFCGPGEKMVLLTEKQDALFVWRKFIDDSGQKGINCAVFRNESEILSSSLVLEAERIAYTRWPGERMYTYVNPRRIASKNPGYCFKKAGWKLCGKTKGGLLILEKWMEPEFIIPKNGLQSIYGSMDYDEREKRVIDFSEGHTRLFATKKSLSGSGCNFQRYCHRAIFVGIDYEFNDFIQAIHRIYRFLQSEQVIIDVIYTEAEEQIWRVLLEKWENHKKLQENMRRIVMQYGLLGERAAERMARSIGVERMEIKGTNWTLVNNDCVEEVRRMADNSIGLIHTSIPFSNHYEYTPSYNDFGHNEDTARFFEQMDYLTPELLRILQPGRVAAIHVKDRVLFGNVTGTGMPTMEPFHAMCIQHYMKHGFAYFGMITVVTDVVRENNQTYRLGWTEQCKDGTKMGVGCPEYILLFRKLPTDRSKAYADNRVTKEKTDYPLSQWQLDAHAFWRSSGDRNLNPEELARLKMGDRMRRFREYSKAHVYDYHQHTAISYALEQRDAISKEFMTLPPASTCVDVWDDINRMKTLNTTQSQRRKQLHVCPLQLDIVERIINRDSNPGDVVFDPFAGLATVPMIAVRMGRKGCGCELNSGYFSDGVGYLRAEEAKMEQPSLFDLMEQEAI